MTGWTRFASRIESMGGVGEYQWWDWGAELRMKYSFEWGMDDAMGAVEASDRGASATRWRGGRDKILEHTETTGQDRARPKRET